MKDRVTARRVAFIAALCAIIVVYAIVATGQKGYGFALAVMVSITALIAIRSLGWVRQPNKSLAVREPRAPTVRPVALLITAVGFAVLAIVLMLIDVALWRGEVADRVIAVIGIGAIAWSLFMAAVFAAGWSGLRAKRLSKGQD